MNSASAWTALLFLGWHDCKHFCCQQPLEDKRTEPNHFLQELAGVIMLLLLLLPVSSNWYCYHAVLLRLYSVCTIRVEFVSLAC